MDNYVYVSVKLYLKEGQSEESIHEVVQDMDYSFDHEQIVDHEIVDIMDTQYEEQPDVEVESDEAPIEFDGEIDI